MARDYSEDQLIQKITAELLEKELGWTSAYAFDQEVLGANGTLGRTSYHEVLLTRHLGQALKRLNPWLTELYLLKEAANAMCASLEVRKTYCTFATTLLKLWKYLDREDITHEMKQQKDAIEAIADWG